MTSKLLCSIAAMLALASIPACSSCNPTTTPRGSVLAAWSITVRSQPIACARVGAASVSLLLHNRASGADVTSTFACTDAQGTTTPMAAGTYDATLTLHAANGATLATAPTQASIAVGAAQVVALAPV